MDWIGNVVEESEDDNLSITQTQGRMLSVSYYVLVRGRGYLSDYNAV